MELLKLATEWAKAEVFSSRFFILFALVFLMASIGFWQLGKTDLAKAYVIPTLVAGVLLLTIGIGLTYTNTKRITAFETAYHRDATAFAKSELERAEKTVKEYKVVFTVVPIIIILAAAVLIFTTTPTWRAIGITTIAMMTVILVVDGTANARIADYKKALELVHG